MQLYVIFLGTGGSWPTVKRNVTSIAIKRGGEIILMDCGEGTQRQIQRSGLSYMQIKSIFISHFHGDHFLGLPGLIQTMQLNDREEPLRIYGPRGTREIVEELKNLGHFKPSYEIEGIDLDEGDEVRFDGYSVKPFRVKHNVPTLGFVLEEDQRPGRFNKSKALELGIPEGPLFGKLQRGESVRLKDGRIITPDMVLGPPRPGRKIVYSGDTRPCDKVIEYAKDADILIHDSTFLSDLEDLAREYAHSTARQAAEIASKANVDKLILTHISPRYVDDKEFEREAREIFDNSLVARDFMKIEVRLKK
ncbi:MAG: ribonuclease Z [Thermoplasmata archaeon]|nr:MAG: ribonuclease Z [Thermoplasmata archaeon]HDO68881.1 ribonuclease Z [Thermoplasmatales archaeon]HEX16796.1 ribonuclease Z [Thermoplasmatales archaeon]